MVLLKRFDFAVVTNMFPTRQAYEVPYFEKRHRIMNQILKMKNPIQNYAWGSHTALGELLGRPVPSPEPEAELWMGAHPKAPSMVAIARQWQPLSDWIAAAPQAILGRGISQKFKNQLPYLFKVLAIAKPLSIQAHPNQRQALQGYAKENRLNVPLNAPNRNYKDANHKPECLCALTTFSALSGFREPDQIVALMEQISNPDLGRVLQHLCADSVQRGLRAFLHELMTLNPAKRDGVIRTAVAKTRQMTHPGPAYNWLLGLYETYSHDIGILAPLFLNLVDLAPGEALYLPAGELHAYLQGVGIELMANSDNVLRGGLTPKHIDLPELMQVLNFTARKLDILIPEKHYGGESFYRTPASEFRLSVIQVSKSVHYRSPNSRGIEMLLCVEGRAWVETPATHVRIEVHKGTSVVVPAAVSSYTITGQAKFYKAGVPI